MKLGRIIPEKNKNLPGDVSNGQGVYFSTLDPKTHTKEQIAFDNWGTALGKKRIDQGKMDWMIKVLNLGPVITPVGRLGVVVYEDDINLTTIGHTIEKSKFKDSATGEWQPCTNETC